MTTLSALPLLFFQEDLIAGLGITWLILLVIWAIVWIWAFLKVLQSHHSMGYKILWLAVITFLPVIGLIVYLLVGQEKTTASV